MKTLSIIVPCYNSADYMDRCLNTLVCWGSDIEVIIVNDGSSDDTGQKAASWAEQYPDSVVVINQENKGHGGAVNTGLAHANGLYFKVVDSDDWLDTEATFPLIEFLRTQNESKNPIDLVVANYIYDKVEENTRQTISYRNVFPQNRPFTWEEVGKFNSSQYLLMHSVFYRTGILKEAQLCLPEHCFYVDNIFVYVPLPQVFSLYYLDKDVYHYYIGREDQSVNEAVMLSRIDQQVHITKIMIDAVDLNTVHNTNLRLYMYNYLSMMMCICSIFLRMEETLQTEEKRAEIWTYLRAKRPGMYAKIRGSILNLGTNLPSPLGRKIGLAGYHLAQRIFKFN